MKVRWDGDARPAPVLVIEATVFVPTTPRRLGVYSVDRPFPPLAEQASEGEGLRRDAPRRVPQGSLICLLELFVLND